MTKELSTEALRMCRQCSTRLNDGGCNLLNRTIATQNQLAEKGECTEAKIGGLTNWYPEEYGKVSGRMIRLENGDWVFQGGNYTR